MSATFPRGLSLCIVDPRSTDYDDLIRLAQATALVVRFFARAGEALRRETDDERLWMVNVDLPDLSGFELCEMLHRPPRIGSIVCLVSEGYSADDERRARCCGASIYTGKPVPASFVTHWIASLVPRAGPLILSTPAATSETAVVLPPRSEGSRRHLVAARRPRRSSTPGTTTTPFRTPPCDYSPSRTNDSN
ncbi:MAG: hypothetical protein KF708_19625 [Pirellulales bacterium]|nr:hypothetical protein [Pirellulales bacterium]